jgi:hypothetical protein
MEDAEAAKSVSNPLHKWALNHHQGPVLWKWTGYFEFYHEAFRYWIGKKPTFLLLGVNTGGDLFMFREYFGAGARIIGIDINMECAAFGMEDNIEVFVGSQANATFIEEVMTFGHSMNAIFPKQTGNLNFTQTSSLLPAKLHFTWNLNLTTSSDLF